MKMAFLLHHLLSEISACRPEAVAIRLEGESLTYGELERKSNQLAHALIAAGVSPGDRVGLHMKKSPVSIISIFGVLKARACYVPVDVTAPAPRLAAIVHQVEMRCLITSSEARDKLSDDSFRDSPLRLVLFADAVSDLWSPTPFAWFNFSDALAGQALEPPALGGTDQDLAYILFTSGSTGKPKGVMLSHLNALTFVNWAYDTFDIKADDRLSNHAPLNFDLSVFDIFVGIKAGATISLVPNHMSAFPVRLSEFIEEHRITVWYSVPSVLTLLLTHGKFLGRDLRNLRLILFAGEVFPVKYLRQLMEGVPHARYCNLYGPTETNVCTYYEVEPIAETQTTPIPIGKACANTEVFSIDERGQRVRAPGQEGLLYVRGSTVMQGYYGRPRDVEAGFIQNPFAAGREEEIFCTGDRVVLDSKGDYHFLGRSDQMIKTRGYRVELGEIESILCAHPSIQEVAATALPDELLGNRIKVFIALQESCSLSESDVKRHCARSLPRYMVPDEVEFRASLPRTSTGKIDRPRLSTERTQAG